MGQIVKIRPYEAPSQTSTPTPTPTTETKSELPTGKLVAPQVEELNNYCAQQLLPKRQFDTAVTLTKRAIYCAPDCGELWANLGCYLWNQQKYQDAKAACERALELKPNYHTALATLALICEGLHDLGKAEEYNNKAFAAAIHLPEPQRTERLAHYRFNRSILYLKAGEYKVGFNDYDSRIDRARVDKRPDYPYLKSYQWKGESLEGKSLYLSVEQGVGDTILFSRFLPWLASLGPKIYMYAQPSVAALLWEHKLAGEVDFLPTGVTIPQVDYHCWMGSLPNLYNLIPDCVVPDVQYIKKTVSEIHRNNPVKLPQGTDTPGSLKVGICWSGNTAHERNDERRIPLEKMLDLLQHPHIWGYSLQCGESARDIKRLGAERLLHNLAPTLEDRGFVGTGSALLGLDLVITCCTSIAHLAGALGVPCWVLLCQDSYWVWPLGKEKSPWWPNIRLFRQQPSNPGWDPVLHDAQLALVQLLTKRQQEVRHNG